MFEDPDKLCDDIISALNRFCEEEGLHSLFLEDFKNQELASTMMKMLYFLERFSPDKYSRMACAMIAACFSSTVEAMPALHGKPKRAKAGIYLVKKERGKS